ENLKRHVQTHHPSSVSRSYPCPQCDARFSRSDLRKRHVRNCHPSMEMTLPAVSWQAMEDELCLPSTGEQNDDLDAFFGLSIPPQRPPSPETQYCDAFFEKFHPTMPLLHEPTFDLNKEPKQLVAAVACIGCLYTPMESRFATSRKMFEEAHGALEEYTREDRSRFQATWVLQAYILLETCGIYMCDDSLLLKAQNIHSSLVGAIRELQMTHDGHASRLETPTSPEPIPETVGHTSAGLRKQWLGFVEDESRKRCIYSIYLLDSQLSVACNLRPQISALEIKYKLPCADDLWSAPTSEAWETIQNQHFRSFNERDDRFGTDEATPSQGSLFDSTQGLLDRHGQKRDLPTLRLLWYSPFAAFVLVTQLQMMARELTHAACLLERPKRCQRNLSILTEAQHGQISQALRSIAELTPRPNSSPAAPNGVCSPSDQFAPLWHSFWITWRYTSITISHPDSLLVTGIVETNLPAAIATAGHLARPRRKQHRDVYEDRDVFRILNDLEHALDAIGRGPGNCSENGGEDGPGSGAVERENPFLTLLVFKICLVGWRIVRLATADAGERDAQDGSTVGRGVARLAKCTPSRFVLQSIMAVINGEDGAVSGDSWANGEAVVMLAELEYLKWVQEQLLRRSIWPVGRWEAAIMEEAAVEAADYVSLLRESDV
ncbi:Zinc finger C2H2-type protein, partial [Macrophomina phaseolina MS6]